MRIPFEFVAILACAGCVVPREYPATAPRTLPAGPAAINEPVSAEPAPSPEAPRLFARDGRVVDENATEPLQKTAARELQGGSESSRSTILEWYQTALEEREQLQREVTTLQADLAQTSATLRAAEAANAELRQRIAKLEADQQAASQLNLELAGRLTTAQVRRLQAEKLLLETKLQQSQRLQAAATNAATPEKPANGGEQH